MKTTSRRADEGAKCSERIREMSVDGRGDVFVEDGVESLDFVVMECGSLVMFKVDIPTPQKDVCLASKRGWFGAVSGGTRRSCGHWQAAGPSANSGLALRLFVPHLETGGRALQGRHAGVLESGGSIWRAT
jgi:hypothetical protein